MVFLGVTYTLSFFTIIINIPTNSPHYPLLYYRCAYVLHALYLHRTPQDGNVIFKNFNLFDV